MSDENTQGITMDEIDLALDPLPAEPEIRPLSEPSFEAATAAAEAEVELGTATNSVEDDLWDDFLTPNPHVTLAAPVKASCKLPVSRMSLHGLGIGVDEANKLIEAAGLDQLTEERIAAMSPAEKRLVNVVQKLSDLWQTNYYRDSFKAGDWQQSVRHNDSELTTSRMKMDRVSDPVLKIRNSIGQGALVQIPLWNTGLWITLRAPSNDELLTLDQHVRAEKTMLGRHSNGMVFSNSEVYTVAAYARFVLEHVYSVTYQFDTADHVEELLGLIKCTDYPQLLYGLLVTMYPDGYPFRQPCVANPHKCDHVEESILSIARLSWTDRSRLTEKQKRMMASRSTKRDLAWIKEYQADFPYDNRSIPLNANITAHLAVPSLKEQIDAGYRWVEGIYAATEKAFGLTLSETDRLRHIYRSGTMTALRQYSHWFSRLEIQEKDGVDPTVIDDPDKKDEALAVLSGDKKSVKKLEEAISKWIDQCSVTVIGLPKSPCPACQQPPSPELSKHPHLIPLDVGYVFFTLAVLKLRQVELEDGE